MTDSAALLCVDLQVDFLHPEGRLPVDSTQVETLLETANKVVVAARRAGVPVAHVVNAFPRRSVANLFRGFSAIEGTAGARRDTRGPVRLAHEPEFYKQSASAFDNPDLLRWLEAHGITDLTLCGVFAGGCIRATTRSALNAGLRVHVLAGGVADRSDASRDRALRRMRADGASVVPPRPAHEWVAERAA